ncbi:YnfA family protein [Neisseria shayeganii]|uniref:YnfA family protein n=1 Tax=Neisseria shayeganii 871 TaxID=1032488 RepID=G4CKJ3_9NEIS|nr:YnfA family protein [Neisseria shayeganii]EGY51669.1 YnfA family protein [Neisseria shayeganii 871]
MNLLQTFFLFVLTALAEIVGCWLPYLWLNKQFPAWVLLPAAASLALFAWLLSLHPTEAGRTYAAYGGVYIGSAMVWLWLVEGVRPQWSDYLGAALCLCGAAVILLGASKTV